MNENKIDIILNSAQQLMCDPNRNEKEITVDMIAKNAKIGKGSIYYYFKSKEEIVDAVIERSYSAAIREYFNNIQNGSNTFEKIKTLFRSILKKEFRDKSKNIIISLHLQDDIIIHHKMLMTAVKVVSPLLTALLAEGRSDGSIRTETPKESAEMIVAMSTFLFDNNFFPLDNESMARKLKLYARVLETCLETPKGSFDFLFTAPEDNIKL